MNTMIDLLSLIAEDQTIDRAYSWLCQARKDYSSNSDVWNFRRHWGKVKPKLQKMLKEGTYEFGPLQQHRFQDKMVTLWSSQDALVLRAMASVLGDKIRPQLSHVYHVKGQGGIGGALAYVRQNLKEHTYVLKTDIKQYYESITHKVLLTHLEELVPDERVMMLVKKALLRTETYGGLYWDVREGIPMGSALSPLLGAVALHVWDKAMEKLGVIHARYMDDLIVLTTTRHALKRSVRVTHKILEALKLRLHPDKTFIGKISRGFDYLGCYIEPKGARLSTACTLKAATKAHQLYEQTRDEERVRRYWKRFLRWGEGMVIRAAGEAVAMRGAGRMIYAARGLARPFSLGRLGGVGPGGSEESFLAYGSATSPVFATR